MRAIMGSSQFVSCQFSVKPERKSGGLITEWSCRFVTRAKHENTCESGYDRLGLRGMKADISWSGEPATESGLDIAPNPKLSPRCGESTQGRLVYLSMSSGAVREEPIMENVFPCCAGLDIHQKSVEACVRRLEPTGQLHHQTRHWGTMTRDLLAMADWMAAQGVTHVAMESTGVYWKPIYNILESRFTVLLVNARHLKQVPGHKSDVRDCQWIAQVLQQGQLTEHHRFLLRLLWKELAQQEELIAELDRKIEEHTRPFANEIERLDAVPGVDRRVAEVVLAEVGSDVKPFPTHFHVASWAGMSPGNEESAGKRRRGRITPGNRWLKRTLVQAAWAASHTKNTYLASQYRRLAGRRGKKRALVAVGHSMLVIFYHMLKERTTYKNLGGDFFDRLEPERLTRYYVKRLKDLGHKVTLEPGVAA